MSPSPGARLFFGFDLDEMYDEELGDYRRPSWLSPGDGLTPDWEEEYARRMGLTILSVPENFPLRDREAQRLFRETPEYLEFAKNQDELRSLIRACPVDFSTYGCEDVPRYCVRIKATVYGVSDWGSRVIEMPLPEIQPNWVNALYIFVKLMELPVDLDTFPKWHLNCSYE